jgi:hypothetical protein
MTGSVPDAGNSWGACEVWPSEPAANQPAPVCDQAEKGKESLAGCSG